MDASQFSYVKDLVREHAAIVLEAGKEYLVETRLDPVARRTGHQSVAELIEKLRVTPFASLHLRVIEAMTTNETSFFRDQKPWEALRLSLIPELMSRQKPSRKLRMWSAASSSGQEVYSLSMLLLEHFPSLQTWDVQLLATDISSEMVRRAREGVFSQFEVNRGLSTPLLLKYFKQRAGKWQLCDEVLQRVEFRELNLLSDFSSLGRMDLVMMRNVLIYFDLPTKRQILERVLNLIGEQGFLILGGSETPLSIHDGFRPHEVCGSIAYCARERKGP